MVKLKIFKNINMQNKINKNEDTWEISDELAEKYERDRKQLEKDIVSGKAKSYSNTEDLVRDLNNFKSE
jgi:hypothetical protein